MSFLWYLFCSCYISIMKPYEDINILIEIKPIILGNTWKIKILLTVFCGIAICKTPSSYNISTDTGKINTEWRAEVRCLNWSCAAKQYFPVARAHDQSLQSCPILCNPVNCRPPGSSVHGILQWIAMPSSRGSSQPSGQTQVSCIASRFSTHRAMWEASYFPV